MRRSSGTFTFIVLLVCASIQSLSETMIHSSQAQKSAEPAMSSAISNFSFDVYRRYSTSGSENLVVSPLSVHVLLSALVAGAENEARSELERALQLPSAPETHSRYASFLRQLHSIPQVDGKPAFALDLANAVWSQTGFPVKQTFRELLDEHYSVYFEALDFSRRTESALRINRWISAKTKNKVRDLISENEIDPLSRLVLTNSLYFKSRWEHQFTPEMTSVQPFYIRPDETTQVPLMGDIQTVAYFSDSTMQLVALPYVGRELELIVALPSEQTTLEILEAELSATRFNHWLAAMKETRVEYYLPRFSFSARAELSAVLKALGISRIFEGEKMPFREINSEQPLSVSKILHEATIAVDEHGTEATATTAAIVVGGSYTPEPPTSFRADRPFLFFLVHKSTSALLFLGRVVRP